MVESAPVTVLIVAETEGPGGGAVAQSAEALETLIAHFDENCSIISAADYEDGKLRGYSCVFYLGGKPDTAPRAGFAADVSGYEGTAVWVGPGVGALGDEALRRLGLEVPREQETLAAAIPWTISYGGQRHVERVPVPAVTARAGAEVLSEARHGGDRCPFMAGKDGRWYAASGPSLERERLWTSCIWADGLHEILERPHEERGRRLVPVLRDVPIWTTPEQVPRAIGPMLEAGVPVAVLASTNWGEVPLAERPQAINGLREAESLGATVVLVSNSGIEAQEQFELAWEVGIHPVAWAGPSDGGNPFRLRIAGPDGSPPYCAGGLLPAPITVSDAGDVARSDLDRLRMQEVVRDGVALVSFGLWAPAEPYLEFLRSRTSAGWETSDLRDFGVRVNDPRRTIVSGEVTVRVVPGADARQTTFGPRWQVVEQKVLPAASAGETAHEIRAPGRSAAAVELLREREARPFIKGVTVDPSAYSRSGISSKRLAEMLAERFSRNGVNTVFFYAYNVGDGAAYRTRYRGASISEWGRRDLLAHMLEACHARDIRVVAWMYSGRDRRMWLEHPEWRERTKDGKAHNPLRLHAAYFLCTRNPEVRRWYSGLLRDLGRRYPTLDGIELCEPVVNWFGTQACYCEACRRGFADAHPRESLGGAVWRKYRAQGMTEFLTECMKAIAEEGIDSYVMTISDALDNGAILSPRRQAEESGFDLEALLDGPYPPGWMNFEIIWQQWAAIYGRDVFDEEWAGETARRLVRRTDGRAGVVLHVELTDFGSQRMTPADIAATIAQVETAGADGIECYHAGAIDRKRAWPVLKRSYEELP
ncbi:MAG: family 10 glycosylhydrolase [Armatimonadota bacterium]|nr:MAG: family 10 glycosylhydrolase [Armatimonadota bacterium]